MAHHSTGIAAFSSMAAIAVLHHQAGASERSSVGTACHCAYSFTARSNWNVRAGCILWAPTEGKTVVLRKLYAPNRPGQMGPPATAAIVLRGVQETIMAHWRDTMELTKSPIRNLVHCAGVVGLHGGQAAIAVAHLDTVALRTWLRFGNAGRNGGNQGTDAPG